MGRFYIRTTDERAKQIGEIASSRGFDSVSAFVRQAISNEVRFGDSAIREAEDRIAATLERLATELRRIQTAQQAQYAILDSLVRLFLVCVPEPSGNAVEPAKARAASRYNNFLKNVARNMTGNSGGALEQLRGNE